MPKAAKSDAHQILLDIARMGSLGQAEAEPEAGFLQRFLPLPEHARALDPDVVLAIGDRGAGKTELFRAIQFPDGLVAIRELGGSGHIPDPNKSQWLVGYSSTGTEYPAELAFRQFSRGKQATDLQIIWLGLLLRCLRRKNQIGSAVIPSQLLEVADANPIDLNQLFSVTQRNIERTFGILDELDSQLSKASRWIFLSYDELDRVSAGDWDELKTILRGLVQFWASYARRWRHVRPKIFLRRDLYDRVALFGPDVSKIAAQRVELVWNTRNLYALLAKRLLNHSQLLMDYFRPSLPAGEFRDALGWFPTEAKEDGYRKFIERMCGRHMGAGPSKGIAFTWIPNHLQDGNGRVLPRSMVRLFEGAAEIELKNQKAEWPRIVHHTSLRGALDRVSQSRVQELEDEEFPWMKTVRSELAKKHPHIQVPIERWDLERQLNIEWAGISVKPPELSGHGLLQLLIELGVFYLRADGRVDARDLYLSGFGLKRKGGVKRPF